MAKKPDDKKRFIHPHTFHIFVDGSFRPSDSASCAYLIFSERTQHIVKMSSFAFRGRTINQMELMAINKALDHANMDYVVIYSDSQYSISCLTLWHKTWEKTNWKTPLGEPVKNKDLIVEILEKIAKRKFVRFVKVQAHTGDHFNSVVDYLATNLSKRMVLDPTFPDGEYPA